MMELAGDKIVIEQEPGKTTITFDDKGTGRVCGACQLCCKLVPVPSIDKAAGQRCVASRVGHGCTIYARRPMACRTWSCRWLADRETAGMPRPDRCHYVIDATLDHVRSVPNDGGDATVFDVIQIWVDPAFPDAHRAPELRAYMARMAEKYRLATIVRFDDKRAITIFPPAFDVDHQWHEFRDSKLVSREELERNIGGANVSYDIEEDAHATTR